MNFTPENAFHRHPTARNPRLQLPLQGGLR